MVVDEFGKIGDEHVEKMKENAHTDMILLTSTDIVSTDSNDDTKSSDK